MSGGGAGCRYSIARVFQVSWLQALGMHVDKGKIPGH
jgi:hypothetical protein